MPSYDTWAHIPSCLSFLLKEGMMDTWQGAVLGGSLFGLKNLMAIGTSSVFRGVEVEGCVQDCQVSSSSLVGTLGQVWGTWDDFGNHHLKLVTIWAHHMMVPSNQLS